MRLYAPMYEGDSFLRPDSAIGASGRAAFKAPFLAPKFVRSNMGAEAANQTALDIHAIEQTARVLRSAKRASLLRGAFTAVADWLERSKNRERDNFFAASANLADLERRQRHFERTGLTHNY